LHNHETLQDVDEDELAAELEELEASELDKELLEPAPVPVTKVSLPIG
jgi:charged multivesicular body protein 4A/B